MARDLQTGLFMEQKGISPDAYGELLEAAHRIAEDSMNRLRELQKRYGDNLIQELLYEPSPRPPQPAPGQAQSSPTS